ncbi:hypothetical protein NQD34_017059 [Periophthalmus magnuspinnatus]|nr:hypothetical protein NQD34_017059 [Periophthalmus magnuspinnatus]
MSPTMIMVLTAAMAYGFGHPLHLLKHNRLLFESSSYLNKSSWNVSLNTANYTDDLHMNMSQVSKNKTEFFPMGNNSVTNGIVRFACSMSLCPTVVLADRLSKGGDEVAGSDTKNPLSPGK